MSAFSTKFKTTWILAVVCIALAIWDLYARKQPEGTISEVLLSSARNSPLLPLFVGILLGHLFWPQQVPK